jgi:hypothetical protein
MSMRAATAVCSTVVFFTAAPDLSSCPFCAKLGRTISDQVSNADWVGFGMVASDGTGLILETSIKSPSGGPTKGTVQFSKTIGSAGERKMVFAQIESSSLTLRPTRSQSASAKTVVYLSGLAAIPSRGQLIGYFFKHLDAEDETVRDDAYKAISKMTSAELADRADVFDRVRLRKWILDPKQPGARIGLYGLMLGMAGADEDAAFLAEAAASRKPRDVEGRDGFLGGLALLNRRKAESLAIKQLADKTETLTGRQAALNAITFILDELPRRDPQPLLEGLTTTLPLADLRDAVVDVLRLHSAAFAAERVFAAVGKATPSRAVVKFALASPSPEAERFLERVRKTDPQLVKDCESALPAESRLFPAPPFRISERRRLPR